ncbi:MAG TPA: S41 family peptidase [Thermoanaerobaculia bacterium]|nr:S41 family peptidase [Thermoanaerobaculia bacterium]
MSKTRILSVAASASLLLALFVVLPGMGADEKDREGKETLYRPLGLFTEVLGLVRSNYVEQTELKPLLAGSFSGMTEAMDSFSEYVPPDKMAAFSAFEAAKEKREVLDTGIVLARRFGFPVVVAAVAGSPAAAAGVKSDDVIEKIDGVLTRSMALWELESKLSGKAGSRVHLAVVRDGKPRHRTLDIVRASWTPSAPSAERIDGETVIRIPSFVGGTTAALKEILKPLDRTRPLVLDLRSSATGSFDEAARAAALFVPAGPLGELSGRRIETKTFRSEPGERVHESRLVLLVDSGTAGPAELFASAVRDAGTRDATAKLVTAERKKASAEDSDAQEAFDPGAEASKDAEKGKLAVRLVGEPTVGMGFTAQVVKLASGGSLKLSVGKIRTVAGRALCPKGLQPDDRVYHGPDDAGGRLDPILQRGLRVLSESAIRAKAAA